MISQDEFAALVATYETHGWVLRRVVMKDKDKVPGQLPPDVFVGDGVVDAAWFSRPQQAGLIAWEIRYLGPTQYALVEHLDENSADFQERMHQTEERLAAAVAATRMA